MEETWKALTFNKNYAVSSIGRIKALPHIVKAKGNNLVPFTKPNLVLKPRIVGNSYQAAIGSGDSRKEYKVDYLVYITFHGEIKDGYFIVHLDGKKLNNSIDNLSLKTVYQIHNVRKSSFKTITDFPSYVINKKGLVINIRTSEKVATVYSTANKCLAIRLWKNNTTKVFYLYRLVAIHFIDNPENKPQVNHKDGDRMNLRLSNLEWVTGTENMKHAVRIGVAKGQFQKGISNRYRHLKLEAI